MEIVLEENGDQKAFQKQVKSHRKVTLNLNKRGTHFKYFSQKKEVTLTKNLLMSIPHRLKKLVWQTETRKVIKKVKKFIIH